MRFILYLIGLVNAFACSREILAIMNGNTTTFQLFITVFMGLVGIACFSAAFNSLLEDIHGGDDE